MCIATAPKARCLWRVTCLASSVSSSRCLKAINTRFPLFWHTSVSVEETGCNSDPPCLSETLESVNQSDSELIITATPTRSQARRQTYCYCRCMWKSDSCSSRARDPKQSTQTTAKHANSSFKYEKVQWMTKKLNSALLYNLKRS